jgi:predicted dehydrogenase
MHEEVKEKMADFEITRRDFNKGLAGAAVSIAASAGPLAQSVLGANDRIGVGLIGAGGMGQFDLKDFLRSGQVDAIAIADPFQPNLDRALELTDGKAKGFKDFRAILDNKDIQAVIIATPDHWHAIPMIMACEAGKDVYVEKPLSHTLAEGRKMVQAAAKHNRVVQVGTQQRSGEHFQKAVELVHSGKIGKVTLAETWIHSNGWPEGMGNPPDSDPPSWLDWDLWLGPAPYHAYNRNRCIGSFRSFWDYSGGTLTDWGVHLLDVVHWAMGVDAPKTVSAFGGKYVIEDNGEIPDTLKVVFEYPVSPVSGKEFVVTWSNRHANSHGPDGHSYGVQFYGTEGTLFIDREGYTLWPERKPNGGESVLSSGVTKSEGSAQHYPHVLNFLECLRSRRKPNSDVETTHRSTSAPHVANIAFKLGRKLRWNRDDEQFPNDPEANKLLTKQYRKPWDTI